MFLKNSWFFPSCKKLLEILKLRVDNAWLNTNAPTVIRSDKVFGQTLENHVLCQIMTSGRYFAAFYGTICKSKENYEIDIIDIFDRSSRRRVRRLDSMPAKPDILRIVEELGVFLLSYPGLLSLEIVSILLSFDEFSLYLYKKTRHSYINMLPIAG